MPMLIRQCTLDRRPWPKRAVSAAARPLTRYLSHQAAHPRGLGGALLGRLWVKETAAVNDAAVELLAPTSGQDILELGFGPGRTLRLIADRGANVSGVEVSTEMVRLASGRNADLVRSRALTLGVGDGVMIPLDDDSVDAVLSVHNLYFWADPEVTIGEIARVLRPGGRVLLVFRGREHPLPNRLDPEVYGSVTTAQCLTWLAAAGFTAVRCQHAEGVSVEVSFATGNLQASSADHASGPGSGCETAP